MHDLSNDSAGASIKEELMRRLKQFQRELGDPLDLEHPARHAAGAESSIT
jgi:hypothetical protein